MKEWICEEVPAMKFNGEVVSTMLHQVQELVRCKDCKHKPKPFYYKNALGILDMYPDFPEGSKCPCQCTNDTYYSWIPDDDWFCADGEAKT